jgi:hypothetical protein
MNQRDATTYSLRLPYPLRDFLERQAKANFSSINSEILRSIKLRMDAAEQKVGCV